MTLPFRRRHHDSESGHDRARELISEELLAPIAADDTAWLARHLDACGDCRRDRVAMTADQGLLRALRDRAPQPPRDLWARTSAKLDVESRRSRGARRRTSAGRAATRDVRRAAFPIGAAAGVLMLVVVIGTAKVTPPTFTPGDSPGSSQVAVLSPVPQPTAISVEANDVAWIRAGENGYELVISNVDEVCPGSRPNCNSLGADDPGRPVDLGKSAPTGVTMSPKNDQLVVGSGGADAGSASVFVIRVPAGPGETPAPGTPSPTGPAITPDASVDPSATPTIEPTMEPTPGNTPADAIEIATGVILVGEPAYDATGTWLAFSARPSDGSTGPDLYIWRVGDPAATPVTSDHQTYFSGWYGGQVLASRVTVPSAGPVASTEPSAAPTASPDASETPAAPITGYPVSFLYSPEASTEIPLQEPNVWMPVVDPGSRVVVFWSGTLTTTTAGLDWLPGEGSLVLDGWRRSAEAPSADPSATAEPTSEPTPGATPEATGDLATPAPMPPGPAGRPVTLEIGTVADFAARFDPKGDHFAVWVTSEQGMDVGQLHLFVADPETGAVDQGKKPLPGAPALRRFSIDHGRIAWVSPPGQDGQESAVEVLGWSGDAFGEIQTFPSTDLFILR